MKNKIFLLCLLIITSAYAINGQNKPFASNAMVSHVVTKMLPEITLVFKQMGFNYNRSNKECTTVQNSLFYGYYLRPSQNAYFIKACLKLVKGVYHAQ